MQIIQTVTAFIVSLGFVGTIIFAIIKFSADKIAERLSTKYEYKLNERFEAYKSELDKKNYISKTRFDLEFNILGDISNVLLIAVEDCFFLFPAQLDSFSTEEKAKEIYNERYKSANESVFNLQRILGSKSPFISADLYSDFLDIKKLLSIQLTAFEYYGPNGRNKNSQDKVHGDEATKAFLRSSEIIEKHNEIIAKMRNYFTSLEISG